MKIYLSDLPPLQNGKWHFVKIERENGMLRIWADKVRYR